MVVKEIAFTAYPAKDVAKLRAFYSERLGLQFGEPYTEDGVEKYADAKVGNGWFSLITTEWAGEAPARSIAFEVDDVEKSFADLRAAGIAAGEIHDTTVCKMGTFNDPEGNTVTLHQITVPH
jgi:predicted enzyme related to lactoylglutathione lyase